MSKETKIKIPKRTYLTQNEVDQAEEIVQLENKIKEFREIMSHNWFDLSEEHDNYYWLEKFDIHFGLKIEE